MRALNVCTSSARIGWLRVDDNVVSGPRAMKRSWATQQSGMLIDPHFHAGPEGLGGFVVPCVHDACTDVFAY